MWKSPTKKSSSPESIRKVREAISDYFYFGGSLAISSFINVGTFYYAATENTHFIYNTKLYI